MGHCGRVAGARRHVTLIVGLRHTLGQLLLLLGRVSRRTRNDGEAADLFEVVIRHLQQQSHLRSDHK